jgi:hypothetical protein
LMMTRNVNGAHRVIRLANNAELGEAEDLVGPQNWKC